MLGCSATDPPLGPRDAGSTVPPPSHEPPQRKDHPSGSCGHSPLPPRSPGAGAGRTTARIAAQDRQSPVGEVEVVWSHRQRRPSPCSRTVSAIRRRCSSSTATSIRHSVPSRTCGIARSVMTCRSVGHQTPRYSAASWPDSQTVGDGRASRSRWEAAARVRREASSAAPSRHPPDHEESDRGLTTLLRPVLCSRATEVLSRPRCCRYAHQALLGDASMHRKGVVVGYVRA